MLLSLLMPNQELPWAHAASPQECLEQKQACDIAALCAQYDCPEVLAAVTTAAAAAAVNT